MTDSTQVPDLSVVATVYRTGPYLREFTQRVLAAATEAGFSSDALEIVFVNDGCPQQGLEAALEVRENNPGLVRVIDLSRNFGHHKAMMAGLREAGGRYVFLIDSDLEESPEWLVPFMRRMRDQGCDAVYGVQEARKGGSFERFSGELFYRIFNLIASQKITPNSVTARLMSRDFVNALTAYRESEPFLFGLTALAGFRQCPEPVCKGSDSPTSYTLFKKIRLAGYAIVSFSSRPLIYIGLLGVCLTLFAFLYALWLVARYLFWGAAPTGWTSIVVSIWLVGGVIILCIGIVSIYLAKIFEEVKRRPYAVIRRKYE